ncbi:MAG: RAMP superfamily CRISPR-associated protein [Cetobacterium sp.]
MKIQYKIKFLTPGITANSGTIGKDIDIVTKIDSLGNPYIPASHIKGILREKTEEFSQALNFKNHEEIEGIFGSEGMNPSKLRFSNLVLEKSEKNIIESRHGVRIDSKTRTAKENSLFSYEMIPATTIFTGEIQILKEVSEESLKLIIASLFHLNRIGGLKSRGLGKIEVEVEGKYQKNLDSIVKAIRSKKITTPKVGQKKENFKKYCYSLEVEENMILKGKEIGNQIAARDSLQGSTLRGAIIASLFEIGFQIEELLDITVSMPSIEGMFPKLASQFKTKYPLENGNHGYADKVFYNDNDMDGIKLERGSLQSLNQKTEDIGLKIDRKTKSSKEGQLFNSEILIINKENRNNVFIGEIILTEEMSKYLNNKELFLGKKKLKGFGKSKIFISEFKVFEENSLKKRVTDINFKNLVTFTALSDIILPFSEVYDICGQFLELIGIDDSTLEPYYKKSFINMEKLPGYNITNNIRKSDEIIIKSGSVLSYTGDGINFLDIFEKIENSGVGIRKTEGFGKIEICSKEHLRMGGR